MPFASLNKFTVPIDRNGTASDTTGLLMPKLKYRFRAIFTNFGVTPGTAELTRQVVDIKRPNVTFTPITIDVYNSKVYLQGKPEWQETTVNFRDDALGNVTKIIGEQIQKQFDFLEQSSARTGGDYKFQMEYEVLDGGNGNTSPTVLEAWELDGCFLTSVDYGEMSYGSPDPAQIACNIRFDNATQRAGEGVGTTVVTKTPSDSALGS